MVYFVEWFCVAHWEKCVRRYKGTFDIFFGIENGMRKEEMKEQFNTEVK